MDRPLKIAISGKSGCGNSTVSKITASQLGFKMINYTFHTIAAERNMDFKELCKLAEKDSSWDLYLDRRQVEMARAAGDCVLGSRLAVWMLDDADLKVYLTASVKVRAERIQKREGGKLEDVLRDTLARDRSDHGRYLKLYDIDMNHYEFVDLVINTEHLAPEEETNIIIRAVEQLRHHREES